MLPINPEEKIQIIYLMEISVFKIIKLNLMISKPMLTVEDYTAIYSTEYFLHKMFSLICDIFLLMFYYYLLNHLMDIKYLGYFLGNLPDILELY